MRTTYNQLQRQLVESKKSEEHLKNRTRSLRVELLEYRNKEKSLIVQYERIIKEWRKRYVELLENGWKIVFAKIKIWYDKKRGNRTLI